MPKIPNKIRIAGMNYYIDASQNSEGLRQLHGADENSFIFGLNSQKECKIYVAKDLSNEQQQLTLIHEIIHGVFNHYLPSMDGETHEDYVTLIASGLFQIVRDNPQVAKSIFAGESWIEIKKERSV